MNNSIALWNKESKKGTTYASGKTTIEGKQYRITLFVNNNKKTEKSPDYSLIIEENTNNQVTQENTANKPKNNSDDVFKEFNDLVEKNDVREFDLPF